MTESLGSAGAEATSAPGEDLSLKSTEMLLEEMASTMMDAQIEETFLLHYDAIIAGGRVGQAGFESHIIPMSNLKACLDNAGTLTKSPTILPSSIRVTSQKVITLPEVEHHLQIAEVKDAPKRKMPDDQRSIVTADPTTYRLPEHLLHTQED